MIAKSRMSSSEFGASSHSLRFPSMNSFPMIGVTSKDLYWSRTPLSFKGSLWTGAGVACSATTVVVCVSVVDISFDLYEGDRDEMIVGGDGCLTTYSTDYIVANWSDGRDGSS